MYSVSTRIFSEFFVWFHILLPLSRRPLLPQRLCVVIGIGIMSSRVFLYPGQRYDCSVLPLSRRKVLSSWLRKRLWGRDLSCRFVFRARHGSGFKLLALSGRAVLPCRHIHSFRIGALLAWNFL